MRHLLWGLSPRLAFASRSEHAFQRLHCTWKSRQVSRAPGQLGQLDPQRGASSGPWASTPAPPLLLVTVTPSQAPPPVPMGPLRDSPPSFPDGKPVEVDPHHILIEDPDGSCTLILDNLTGVDSGQYMCFAASAAGNASTLGKILVQGEPGREAGVGNPDPTHHSSPHGAGRWYGHLTQAWRLTGGDRILLHHVVAFCLFLSLSLCVFVSVFLCLCLSSLYLSSLPSLCFCLSLILFISPSLCLSLSLHMVPTVPPRFVNKVRAVPFVEGEDAQITCTIEGAPHPQIRWAWVMRWVGLLLGGLFSL